MELAENLGEVGAESYDASVAFSGDGTRLVTSTLDPVARIWDTSSGALVATVRAGATRIDDAFFDGDHHLVTHDSDRRALVWDAATGEKLGGFDDVDRLRLSPDRTLLVASSGRRVRFFDLDEGAVFARGCGILAGFRDIPALTPATLSELRAACARR